MSPEAVMPLPGVIAGFNLALRALTAPGDGLLIQTPVYPPILRAAGNHGLTRDEHALARGADGRYAVDLDALRGAHQRHDARVPALQPAQPGGPRVRARRARGAWPPPACGATSGSSPTRSTASCCSTAAARADRLARARDRAAHDHAHGAQQDVQPAGPEVRGGIIPNAALRERFAAAAADLVPRSTCSATPRPSPPTATATRGWRRCCTISRPTATSSLRELPRRAARRDDGAAGGDLPGAGSTAAARASPAAIPTRSSSSAPRSRSTTARPSVPAARASCG